MEFRTKILSLILAFCFTIVIGDEDQCVVQQQLNVILLSQNIDQNLLLHQYINVYDGASACYEQCCDLSESEKCTVASYYEEDGITHCDLAHCDPLDSCSWGSRISGRIGVIGDPKQSSTSTTTTTSTTSTTTTTTTMSTTTIPSEAEKKALQVVEAGNILPAHLFDPSNTQGINQVNLSDDGNNTDTHNIDVGESNRGTLLNVLNNQLSQALAMYNDSTTDALPDGDAGFENGNWDEGEEGEEGEIQAHSWLDGEDWAETATQAQEGDPFENDKEYDDEEAFDEFVWNDEKDRWEEIPVNNEWEEPQEKNSGLWTDNLIAEHQSILRHRSNARSVAVGIVTAVLVLILLVGFAFRQLQSVRARKQYKPLRDEMLNQADLGSSEPFMYQDDA